MVSGQLAVADLPDAWREGMLELLGVAPDADDHAQGCMQDLHWCDVRVLVASRTRKPSRQLRAQGQGPRM